MSTNGNNGALPLSAEDVINGVAAAYHLNPGDLVAYGRIAPRPAARLVAYRLLHDECHLSWAGVAAVMNRVKGGWIAVQAHKANPDAVTELRSHLRTNGHQEQLFG